MYYKVFISHKEIAFVNATLEGFYTVKGINEIEEFYNFLNNCDESKIAIIDPKGIFWKVFKDNHKLINAAGGLVLNKKSELLVIKRLGLWDLPKGKLESGETIKEAAKREVEEECGITDGLLVGNSLPDTFHTYVHKNINVLKQTHWFNMNYEGKEFLTPQEEEGITEVRFMSKQEIENVVMKNTYASLLPLFQAYLGGDK